MVVAERLHSLGVLSVVDLPPRGFGDAEPDEEDLESRGGTLDERGDAPAPGRVYAEGPELSGQYCNELRTKPVLTVVQAAMMEPRYQVEL